MPGTPVDCSMELSVEFVKERESCLQYFGCWSETEQVHFVKSLLSGMCHYQHGQVDLFLKPMLQRDFISALPGDHAEKFCAVLTFANYLTLFKILG